MKQNKKGFTLAELLIVVAIIGVLVAIAIPVFSGQLGKAKQATIEANLRSAYAEGIANYLSTDEKVKSFTYGDLTYTFTYAADDDITATVTIPSDEDYGDYKKDETVTYKSGAFTH